MDPAVMGSAADPLRGVRHDGVRARPAPFDDELEADASSCRHGDRRRRGVLQDPRRLRRRARASRPGSSPRTTPAPPARAALLRPAGRGCDRDHRDQARDRPRRSTRRVQARSCPKAIEQIDDFAALIAPPARSAQIQRHDRGLVPDVSVLPTMVGHGPGDLVQQLDLGVDRPGPRAWPWSVAKLAVLVEDDQLDRRRPGRWPWRIRACARRSRRS